MKHSYLIALSLFVGFVSSCKHDTKDTTNPGDADSLTVSTTIPDSTLWGHLGEDTGMSALEFITDQGDTLELYRTNQETGEDGLLLGNIRNYDDRFAITISADGETMKTAINVTQLMQMWENKESNLQLQEEGKVEADNMVYKGWELWNGHLLMASEQQHEYARVTRVDTMNILWLDKDSLVIQDHIGQIMRFTPAKRK